MLNELLKDEEFGRIFFAELLNQNCAETGVDTQDLFQKWARLHPDALIDYKEEDDIMEDIPISIKELEEKGKDEPMVTLAELEERQLKNGELKKGIHDERLAEPDYYAGNGLSPLEAFKKGLLSREETIGFIKGNVIKYTVRAGKKDNASKDIVKAIDYLTHLKELYESDERSNQAQELMKQAFEDLNKIEERQ